MPSDTGGVTPFFTVADSSRTRVYVRAPELCRPDRCGQTVRLALPDRIGETSNASMVRTAGAIDARSGLILVELQLRDQDGKLPPDAYAQVVFELPAIAEPVPVPESALLHAGNEPALIAVGHGDRMTLKTPKLGRVGPMVEIVSGVSAEERVFDAPQDAIRDEGDVRPA